MNLSSQLFSTTLQRPLVVMGDTSNGFFQSLKNHPAIWTLASLTWVASCAVVWKLQLMALERNVASFVVGNNPGPSPKESSKINELKKLPWYTPQIGSKLNETMRVLLEEYGGISRRDQEAHIYRIRDAAFEALPIGTIGEFWFLVLGLAEHPMYKRIIERLTLGTNQPRPTLIDLGTCLGQDIRKLIHDGVQPAQLLGVDKYPQFLVAGHEMFRDYTATQSCFKAADIFDSDEKGVLRMTTGSWDIVASAQLLHAFDWAKQKQVVKLMFQLARGKGSWLAGLLTGGLKGHSVPVPPPLVPVGVHVERYIHSTDTLRKLFQEAVEDVGLSVKIDVRYQEDPGSLYTTEITKGVFYLSRSEAIVLFCRDSLKSG